MYQLMYYSLAREDLNEKDITSIVEVANIENHKTGITGFLSFNGNEFLQFMEGPEIHVRKLMENIERDNRHTSIFILKTGLADTRIFPDWSMQRLNVQKARNGSGNGIDHEHAASIMARLNQEFSHAYKGYLGI